MAIAKALIEKKGKKKKKRKGAPQELHSDQGIHFIGQLLKMFV
jgi:hypothetical protein